MVIGRRASYVCKFYRFIEKNNFIFSQYEESNFNVVFTWIFNV